jgi:predicted ATPase
MNPSTSPLLIGREKETEALRGVLGTPPAVVAVEGEAGVGKTRLVGEVARDPAFDRHRRLIGFCPPLREPFPLGPFLEAIRSDEFVVPKGLSPLLGALRPLLPEIADRLPPELSPLNDARADRHRTFRAIRELLIAFGPTVLILEDLHWADETTVELLAFLGSQIPPELSLVVTYRLEDLDARSPLLDQIGRASCRERV